MYVKHIFVSQKYVFLFVISFMWFTLNADPPPRLRNFNLVYENHITIFQSPSWSLPSSNRQSTAQIYFFIRPPLRERRYGDVWAESGGDRSDQEEGRRDPAQAVWRNLGALWRNSVPQESHREQAGPPHTRHRHASESPQVKPEQQAKHTAFVWSWNMTLDTVCTLEGGTVHLWFMGCKVTTISL